LFSGCSAGHIESRTALELVGPSEYRRHTRLDAQYLAALSDSLARAPGVWESLRYRPNSSLCEAGDQLRYVEAQTDPATRARSFHLVAAERSSHLLATLRRAAEGATARDLAQALVNDDVSMDEALAYIATLVEAQVLESELEPCVTGQEPLDGLLVALNERELEPATREILRRVRADLVELDALPLGSSVHRYRAVRDVLSALPLGADPARLFQVDLHKPARALTLGPAPMRELASAIELLRRIGSRAPSPELSRFIAAFGERYELAEIPLLEALDEERGVGASLSERSRFDPSTLLDDIDLPERPSAPSVRGARDEFLVQAATTALGPGQREWVLSDRDIEALGAPQPADLPDAFAAFASIAAESAEAVDRADFLLHLRGVSGPSGARLFGRFCHSDPALLAAVRAHLSAEAALRPHAVFAEIVHLPEGRVGNILCRPVLRDYEIPYLGRSGAPRERQISVQDLLVSVRGDRIVLRSRSLGVEVVPRLTTAHRYVHTELMVYRFLCALQASVELRWTWGDIAGCLPFLPRVRRGRSVLSLARWQLCARDLEPLAVASSNERRQAVLALRARLGLPRWVSLADHDHVLRIDWDNSLMVESFLALVKERPSVSLVEVFPEDDQLCVVGPEGRFAHELIVPFVSTRQPDRPPRPAVSADTARHFAPGSEWLYAKIYSGPATADRLLLDVIAPLRRDALADGAADAWFFVRYADPLPHLRVRFHGPPDKLLCRVVPALNDRLAPWLGDGRVSRFQLDTYVREVERYGGTDGIPLAEQLFFADSEAVLQLIATVAGDDRGADQRWRFALYGMHTLLLDLELTLPERLALLTRLEEEFARRCRTNQHSKLQVASKFRQQRGAISALLARRAPDLEPTFQFFDRRSAAWRAPVQHLARHAATAAATQSLSALAASFLHMHANRMLRSEQPLQEWILYEFLRRTYVSERARRPAELGAASPGRDGEP
jgi:thiopeptide-type bacteriocin biosynthesis protein